jgi:hypothetical protein
MQMKKTNLWAILILLCMNTLAQPKIFRIAPGQTLVDGIVLGINPGDTLFLEPGDREELHFLNITGTAEKPVIITNHQGKVVVRSQKRYGIAFDNSVYFRFTGTGSSDKYGIEIASSRSQGLSISNFSSNCEADHLEIHHVGYAGIMAKTDPDCSRKDLRCFTMKNLSFHDNLIYETGSEGFYIGFSWFPIRPFRCGQDSILYAHEIHGIRIYNNNLHDTHAEAIQVGSSTRDVKIYCNSIRNYGSANNLWQNNGVQIGAGTVGDFFNNIIDSGPGDAVSFFGGGGNRLFNNLIINAGSSAIFHNDKEAVIKGRSYQIMNNTIINPGQFGITIISGNTWTNKLYNNVVVTKDPDNGILGYVDSRWYSGNNKVFRNIEDAGFVDPASSGFGLAPQSALIDSGFAVPWLEFDYHFKTRPAGANYDIGAFEFGGAPATAPDLSFEQNSETEMVQAEVGPDGTYSFSLDEKKAEIVFFDGTGVVQDATRVERKGRNLKIDFSGLPQGVYYVGVKTGDKRLPLKRIINKK